MKIERIDHLNLTVADIDRSVEFYQRVLGMKTESMGEGRAAPQTAAFSAAPRQSRADRALCAGPYTEVV